MENACALTAQAFGWQSYPDSSNGAGNMAAVNILPPALKCLLGLTNNMQQKSKQKKVKYLYKVK